MPKITRQIENLIQDIYNWIARFGRKKTMSEKATGIFRDIGTGAQDKMHDAGRSLGKATGVDITGASRTLEDNLKGGLRQLGLMDEEPPSKEVITKLGRAADDLIDNTSDLINSGELQKGAKQAVTELRDTTSSFLRSLTNMFGFKSAKSSAHEKTPQSPKQNKGSKQTYSPTVQKMIDERKNKQKATGGKSSPTTSSKQDSKKDKKSTP